MAMASKQQQVFIEHYLQCWNATEAARRAGYSERTARQQGSRLLARDDIAEAIAARLAELKMSSDEVLVRLADHARGSMADFTEVDGHGRLKFDFKKAASANKLHLIREFEILPSEYGVSVRVKLYDAQAALVQLGKHHKLWVERHEVADWRREALEAGLNPDELEHGLAEHIYGELVRSGAARLDGGGAGAGEGTA
jgi:phage terminase small subunit